MKMRAVGYLAVSAILFSGIVNAEDNNTGNDEDMYYWNAMAHPYQECELLLSFRVLFSCLRYYYYYHLF